MNYKNTLKFLYQTLPMYQRSGKAAYKANLDNTKRLDNYLGNPHKLFKSIHVAGTNGKGSVSHMLASVLQSAGCKTGLYTSPHLLDFRERIRINGKMIPKVKVTEFVENMHSQIEAIHPSFFEMTVALAFDHFAKEKVDIAIIETGMGGRLDSTNIITPEISVITNISLDHTEFLGDTIEKIAREKGGIIKQNIPLIIGTVTESVFNVLKEIADNQHSTTIRAEQKRKFLFQTLTIDNCSIFHFQNNKTGSSERIISDMTGSYQSENIGVTLSVIDQLKHSGMNIPDEAISNGFQNIKKNTGLRGRWETVAYNPRIITDTAHNEDGIKHITAQLKQLAHKNLHIIWGMVGDKPANQIFQLLPKEAKYYLTEPSIPRAMPITELIHHAANCELNYDYFSDVAQAFAAAKMAAKPEDTIYIGGSTFIVADFLTNLQDINN